MNFTEPSPPAASRRPRVFSICLLVFLLALGVRLLAWQDYRFEARRVQTGVTVLYKETASLLLRDGLASAFSSSSAVADPTLLCHPPGYPLLLVVIFRTFGESDAAIQITQIILDALLAVVVMLLAGRLLSSGAAGIAGVLVALAPQLAYNATMLLPDTLAALPLVIAIHCFVRAGEANDKRYGVGWALAAGAMIGVSCWLRANALLLAPFVLFIVPVVFRKELRVRVSIALVLGALIVVAPITLRNLIVYRQFIPLSLGAGQTLLEGIADYDAAKRFGMPNTDLGIARMEAAEQNRPDYAATLFGREGVARDRARVRRGVKIIKSNPVWFASVMARRAVWMLRPERAPLVKTATPFTHSIDETMMVATAWRRAADEWVEERTATAPPRFVSTVFEIAPDTDYVLRIELKMERGRLRLDVLNSDTQSIIASRFADSPDIAAADEATQLLLPFTSGRNKRARLRISDDGTHTESAAAEIGSLELYLAGASAGSWTRPARFVINAVQRFFITAWLLPLAIVGAVMLARRRAWRALAVLAVVPAYYMSVQSALHTEPRYVLVLYCFVLMFAAVALDAGGVKLASYLRTRMPRKSVNQ